MGEMEEEVINDDEDIYGDLETDIFFAHAKKPRLENTVQQTEEYQNLVKENQTLKSKVKQLERDNRAYFNNMSALFLTAKNEIEKKNFIIKNLTDKLKQVTKSKSSLSSKEAEEVLTRCQEALQESQAQLTLSEIKKCLKNECSNLDWKRKRIKFGNMSLYIYREQGSFQREEEVVFKKHSTDNTNSNAESANSKLSSQEIPQPVIPSSSDPPQKLPEAPPRVNNNHTTGQVQVSLLTMKDFDEASRMSFNGIDEMGFPLMNNTPAATQEPDRKRQRRNDKDDSRDRDRNNRRNSDERYNSYKRSRSKEDSPPADRHRNRRGNDDRGFSRKDIDARKSDSSRRQSWRSRDNRAHPEKGHRNDLKPSNSSTHIKHSRSRSKSK